MRRSSTLLLAALPIGAIALVATRVVWGLWGDPPTQRQAGPTEASPSVAEVVQGEAVVRDTLWVTVRAGGRTAAFRRGDLMASGGGAVVAVQGYENKPVRSGELLARLDTSDIGFDLVRARSEFERATAEFERLTLFDDEIADAEIRTRRRRQARLTSGLAAAEVALQREELRLKRAEVRAPFAGRVIDVRVVEGQSVAAGTILMGVVSLDPIRVELGVLEVDLPRVHEGMQALVTLAAFPDEVFKGRVSTINPIVDEQSRVARVTLVVANPDERIRPGMHAEATIRARPLPDRLMVPRAAVLERGHDGGRPRSMVFVFEGDGEVGQARWRYVTTGAVDGRWIEILEGGDSEGLAPGDIVLVDGHHYLAHDRMVILSNGPRGI